MPIRNDLGAAAGKASLDAGDAVRLATFDQHRGLLFSVAYRMLGSVADAEDMLQETFIRWQQAADQDIRSPRAFLITIVTRLCINHLQSARVAREEYVGQWLPEPLVTDPASDPLTVVKVDESLSMAFLVLLERLTPVERAVFLLREVFGYKYGEIAGVLGQSEANCRQILRRARRHVGDIRARFKPSARTHDDLLERFVRAARSGDMDGLVAMLSRDAVLHSDGGGKAIAVPNVIHGGGNVARAIVGGIKKFTPADLVSRITQINGQPGVVSYVNGRPSSVFTIEVRWGRVRAIYFVANPDKLARLPNLPSAPN